MFLPDNPTPKIYGVGTTYGDAAATVIDQVPGIGPTAGNILQAAAGFWDNVFSSHWTGDEEDFVKLYMDITGRARSGEYVEYGHELPEAKVYFSLKYGKKIMNKQDALTVLGETWTPGLGDRLNARADRNWKSVFTNYGLNAPLPYIYPVGDSRNPNPIDYTPVVNAINAGTFPPKGTQSGSVQNYNTNPLGSGNTQIKQAGIGGGTIAAALLGVVVVGAIAKGKKKNKR